MVIEQLSGNHLLLMWMWSMVALSLLVAVRGQNNAIESSGFNQSPQCISIIPFDPKVHKPHYQVAVNAVRGVEVAYEEYYQTFETYLTEAVGKRFDPPITFSMVANLMPAIFGALENDIENVDFLFLNSAGHSCVEAEYAAQLLATSITKSEVRGLTWELDVYAGVVFTRADNDKINVMNDLKDKVIGAGSVDNFNGGQSQLVLMQRLGLDYVMDPKQVVFTNDQTKVVERVLSGDFDVGFVRTETLERFDDQLFKVIKPRTFVMEDGMLFPFLHSTDMFPEHPVAALPHVHVDVSIEVQNALYAYQTHAAAGQLLVEGGLFAPKRCDTTEDIARIAYNASKTGHLAGFRNPRSYADVRSILEEGKFMKMDEKSQWRCIHGGPGTLYDSFECPEGYQKLIQDEFDASCPKAGLTCEDGWDCYCRPCRKSYDVDVFQCDFNHTFDDDNNDTIIGCGKMDLCGTGQQREPIQLCLIDNIRRLGAEVNATMHVSGKRHDVPVRFVNEYMYQLNWSDSITGIDLLEIFIDGKQILQSPFQVAIVERNCDLDYPGRGYQAAVNGDCVCSDQTIFMFGECVSMTIVAAAISVLFLIFAIIAGVYFIRYKNFKNDQLWMVKLEELHFDDPVEVIGQGSFGVVLKAEYRGTKVAIKKAIKQTGKRRSGASGTGSKIQGSASLNDNVTRSGSRAKSSATRATAVTKGLGSTESIEVRSRLHKPNTPEEDEDTVDLEVGQSGTASASMSILKCALHDADGDQHKWGHLGFLKKNENYRKQFRESILGHSASRSRKSYSARLFPWCNEEARLEEAFMAEMRVLAHLRHPCITTVLGAVVSHTHEPMLVMELMEYGSLYDILRNDSMCLAGEIILQICKDIAQGLRYLHSSKPPVMHGDLKARNILIDSRFRAKLCDFGLSNKLANNITGTPFWMAPEYLTGMSDYSCPCDIYSAGIIFWEIYARKSPYEGEQFREVLRKICDRRVNKRPTIDASFPPKMAALMKKCWSKDPSSRPNAIKLDVTLMEMTARDAEPLETKALDLHRGQKVYEDLFPSHIAAALRAGKKVEPEQHDLVTVFFSEIDGFGDISQAMSPEKVCNLLGRLFNALDELSKLHGVFKVETVGCNYMGVTNLNGSNKNDHVKKMAEFAIDMINEASKILIDEDSPERGFVKLRAGFHSGSVVTNVIGDLRPRYGLFGDTVNTASRMQSNSKPNRVLCSEYSHKLLREQAPELPTLKRGKIQVKGKGQMTVFWVGTALITAGREPRQDKVKGVAFDLDDSAFDNHADELKSPVSYELAPESALMIADEKM